ncbi:unnamed protein product, partial [Protopolystoma xenopodis]
MQLQTLRQSPVSRVGAISGAPISTTITVKPTSTLRLSLAQISPRLVGLGSRGHRANCSIPLPGRAGVWLSRLSNQLDVLPTKTRPKCLCLIGTEGISHPYLLKGLEDLRLDDRVMHLLQLANLALRSLPPGRGVANCRQAELAANTYAITPLGVRSGLIQMVQGAVPLFSLYKRWQKRHLASTPDDTSFPAEASSSSSLVAVPRPAELFHKRLRDLLPDGLADPQNRASWPLETLKQVLASLERETPDDLLSRELWASNPLSSSAWWRACCNFSRSNGLSCMLGYLVGLGDRHLDNLLIDFTTGQLIHIDYNVCFDKGRSLRVPERVPFRLTRNLRHPLGPSAMSTVWRRPQVNGMFRSAAISTLSTLRDIADPILIQLEAFLIDPLVDWLRDDIPSDANGGGPVYIDSAFMAAYRGGVYLVGEEKDDSPIYAADYSLAARARRDRRFRSEALQYCLLAATRIALQKLRLDSNRHLSAASTRLSSCLDVLQTRLAAWASFKAVDNDCIPLRRRLDIIGRLCEPQSLAGSRLAELEARQSAFITAQHQLRRISDQARSFLTVWSNDLRLLASGFASLVHSASITRLMLAIEEARQNFDSEEQALSATVAQLVSIFSKYYSIACGYLGRSEGLLSASSVRWSEEPIRLLEEFSTSISAESIDAADNLVSDWNLVSTKPLLVIEANNVDRLTTYLNDWMQSLIYELSCLEPAQTPTTISEDFDTAVMPDLSNIG